MTSRKLRPPRGFCALTPCKLLAPPQSLRQIKPAPYQFALLFSVLCPYRKARNLILMAYLIAGDLSHLPASPYTTTSGAVLA